MKALVNKEFNTIGYLLNRLFKLSPKHALNLSLLLVSWISKKKLRPEDRVFYEMGFDFMVDVNGKKVKGTIWGEGPVLILVHGWMSNAASWRTYVSYFVNCGYQVIALDAPGHGLNARQHFDIAEYFLAIRQLIKQVGNIYAIIGHSIGATAAFFGTLDNPKIFPGKLILINPYHSLHQLANEMANYLKLSDSFVQIFDEKVENILGRSIRELKISTQIRHLNYIDIDLIHADDDPVSAQSESFKLVQSASENVAFHPVTGTGHAKSHPKVVEKVIEIVLRSKGNQGNRLVAKASH